MQGPSCRTQRPILVRGPLHPDFPVPPLPDLRDTTPAGATARRTWPHQARAVENFAETVRHASPGLAATIDSLACAPDPAGGGDGAVLRVVKPLCGDALRATTRPTPSGLFAGNAEGRFADRARADREPDTPWSPPPGQSGSPTSSTGSSPIPACAAACPSSSTTPCG
ncbi:lantibiotic dehydratase [Streptomyces anulatus]|uniref:lantibiotic dehydratase n=1 Tax=Streptomyces anulatus TaxID=1892 RepID=UPI003F49CA10